MILIRKADERGHADHGWLNAHHTFSFASYHDPRHMSFRALRVMNEDVVAPGSGFGTHPHRNMEIVTYILSGALEHKDSMGNGEVLRAGEFQRMSAGTGITHSEVNPSSTEPVHLYQIWLTPERSGIDPSYEQKKFPETERNNQFQLVASPNAESGSLKIHQDAKIYLANLEQGRHLEFQLTAGRHAWLQVLRGSAKLNDHELSTSDGVAIGGESELHLQANDSSEFLLFDLA